MENFDLLGYYLKYTAETFYHEPADKLASNLQLTWFAVMSVMLYNIFRYKIPNTIGTVDILLLGYIAPDFMYSD